MMIHGACGAQGGGSPVGQCGQPCQESGPFASRPRDSRAGKPIHEPPQLPNRLEHQVTEIRQGTSAPANPSASYRERSTNPRDTSWAHRSDSRFSDYDQLPAQAQPGPRGEWNEQTGEGKGFADAAEITSQIGSFKANHDAPRETDTQNRPTRPSENGDRPCDCCEQDHSPSQCPKRKSKTHELDTTQTCVEINTSWLDGDSEENPSDEDPPGANVNNCSSSFVIEKFNTFQQTRTINTEAAQIRTIPRADIVGSGLSYLSAEPLPVEVWLGTVNRPTVTGCLDTGGQSMIGEPFLRKHYPEARVRQDAAGPSPDLEELEVVRRKRAIPGP